MISAALGLTPATLKAIGEGRVARRETASVATQSVNGCETRKSPAPRYQEVALKQSVRHFSGKTLTEKQFAANERLSGMSPKYHANQLILLIEADMLDQSDESLIETLRALSAALDDVLAAQM